MLVISKFVYPSFIRHVSCSKRLRTMVAALGASESFTANFLDERENWSKIEQAQILCSEVSDGSRNRTILIDRRLT
jgi:hypothetical protein